jgi:hypothetical protein
MLHIPTQILFNFVINTVFTNINLNAIKNHSTTDIHLACLFIFKTTIQFLIPRNPSNLNLNTNNETNQKLNWFSIIIYKISELFKI